MATLARRLRQRLGVTSMFMLSGLLGTLCGSGCGAQALASDTIPDPNFSPLPPQVRFISNGKYDGILQTQGIALPITGTLVYLAETTQPQQLLHVLVDTGGQQITSAWVTSTPTVINAWEIVPIDPTTCRNEVLSGDSYPQCTAWTRNFQGAWLQECTVTVQGNKATLDNSVILNENNQLVSLKENTTISGVTVSTTITMQEQGTTPPSPSDFALPSICNAPNGNNQGDALPQFQMLLGLPH